MAPKKQGKKSGKKDPQKDPNDTSDTIRYDSRGRKLKVPEEKALPPIRRYGLPAYKGEAKLDDASWYMTVELAEEPPAEIVKARNEAKIQAASEHGDAKIVNGLIAQRVDVNATNHHGMTALQFASRGKHTSIVLALVEAAADVNKRNAYGSSALNFAAAAGSSAELKGSIGEGPNQTNHSDQSSVRILGIERKPRKTTSSK